MVLRNIVVYVVLPLIMLFVSILGIFFPDKIQEARWVSKPFHFKILEKNENTIRSATICNCICLLIEGILYSILSIMALSGKLNLTSLETFLIIIGLVIISLPIIFIVHFIRFDKDGNLRRNK